MSHDQGFRWSFSLRDSHNISDSDSDPEEPESQQAHRVKHVQEPSPADLDISAREDHANFRPNPWSILKLNAASRKPAISSDKGPTPAVVPQKVVEQRSYPIKEAFERAAKPREIIMKVSKPQGLESSGPEIGSSKPQRQAQQCHHLSAPEIQTPRDQLPSPSIDKSHFLRESFQPSSPVPGPRSDPYSSSSPSYYQDTKSSPPLHRSRRHIPPAYTVASRLPKHLQTILDNTISKADESTSSDSLFMGCRSASLSSRHDNAADTSAPQALRPSIPTIGFDTPSDDELLIDREDTPEPLCHAPRPVGVPLSQSRIQPSSFRTPPRPNTRYPSSTGTPSSSRHLIENSSRTSSSSKSLRTIRPSAHAVFGDQESDHWTTLAPRKHVPGGNSGRKRTVDPYLKSSGTFHLPLAAFADGASQSKTTKGPGAILYKAPPRPVSKPLDGEGGKWKITRAGYINNRAGLTSNGGVLYPRRQLMLQR